MGERLGYPFGFRTPYARHILDRLTMAKQVWKQQDESFPRKLPKYGITRAGEKALSILEKVG
jgi:hypothetical protein